VPQRIGNGAVCVGPGQFARVFKAFHSCRWMHAREAGDWFWLVSDDGCEKMFINIIIFHLATFQFMPAVELRRSHARTRCSSLCPRV